MLPNMYKTFEQLPGVFLTSAYRCNPCTEHLWRSPTLCPGSPVTGFALAEGNVQEVMDLAPAAHPCTPLWASVPFEIISSKMASVLHEIQKAAVWDYADLAGDVIGRCPG